MEKRYPLNDDWLCFNRTDSPDAKQTVNFLDEMLFDIHTKGKSFSDKNLIENYFKKSALLASGIQEIVFLPENSNELCTRLRLIISEKRAGNDTNKFDSEIIAIFDKLLECKCITPTQHKKLF